MVDRRAAPAFDLRCEVREKLIAFLRETYPRSLPRIRSEAEIDTPAVAVAPPFVDA